MSTNSSDNKQTVRLPISRTVPGMELARDIYTRNNQVILNAGSVLDAQKISKLMFYSIDSVTVYKQETELEQTLTQTLKNSVEFREFSKRYDETVTTLKNSINMLITEGRDIDEDLLVEKIDRMIVESGSKSKIFNMLHCIRDYDEMTYMHSVNVALIANCFAQWLSMNYEDTRNLTLAGLLHDIGKTCIPKEILLKPDSLTADEYGVIKTHTVKGYELLKNRKIQDRIKLVALQHHERADGSGYPYGKSGDEIDPFSMIVSIADVYDAMTSDRAYRPKICPFNVIKEFEDKCTTSFDSKYLVPLLEQITQVYINHTVRLSNDSIGKIVLVNKSELSKPVVQVDDIFVDLTKNRDISISEII